MQNMKNIFTFVGAGFVVGVILTVILINVFGAKPKVVNVGGVDFEFPTSTISALDTPISANTQIAPILTDTSRPASIDITNAVADTPAPSGLHICGEPAFNGNLTTPACSGFLV